MGCLNSFSANNWHWFGNIHLSGPCNRKCYFCIGQHMMDLDDQNNLDKWPLKNIDKFLHRCFVRKIKEIYLTGTNTEPTLYKHMGKLSDYIHNDLPHIEFGLRTNGVGVTLDKLKPFTKGSITICSLDKDIYKKMMGIGEPPDPYKFVEMTDKAGWKDLKANIVLGPENTGKDYDVFKTVAQLGKAGIKRINLREPYGQPHIGDPYMNLLPSYLNDKNMPTYEFYNGTVTYWDVHYVEVESVNLYANGRISEDYPITRGHSDNGMVKDQSNFPGGRIREQWINLRRREI